MNSTSRTLPSNRYSTWLLASLLFASTLMTGCSISDRLIQVPLWTADPAMLETVETVVKAGHEGDAETLVNHRLYWDWDNGEYRKGNPDDVSRVQSTLQDLHYMWNYESFTTTATYTTVPMPDPYWRVDVQQNYADRSPITNQYYLRKIDNEWWVVLALVDPDFAMSDR